MKSNTLRISVALGLAMPQTVLVALAPVARKSRKPKPVSRRRRRSPRQLTPILKGVKQ